MALAYDEKKDSIPKRERPSQSFESYVSYTITESTTESTVKTKTIQIHKVQTKEGFMSSDETPTAYSEHKTPPSLEDQSQETSLAISPLPESAEVKSEFCSGTNTKRLSITTPSVYHEVNENKPVQQEPTANENQSVKQEPTASENQPVKQEPTTNENQPVKQEPTTNENQPVKQEPTTNENQPVKQEPTTNEGTNQQASGQQLGDTKRNPAARMTEATLKVGNDGASFTVRTECKTVKLIAVQSDTTYTFVATDEDL
jgi:hypothetical protein